MKVLKNFFCIKTQTRYNKGDEYKGKRKDLGNLVEKPKAPKKDK